MFENEDPQDGPLAREDGMRFRRIVGKRLIYGMVIHLMDFAKKYGISKEEFFYTYINTLFLIKTILFQIK